MVNCHISGLVHILCLSCDIINCHLYCLCMQVKHSIYKPSEKLFTILRISKQQPLVIWATNLSECSERLSIAPTFMSVCLSPSETICINSCQMNFSTHIVMAHAVFLSDHVSTVAVDRRQCRRLSHLVGVVRLE